MRCFWPKSSTSELNSFDFKYPSLKCNVVEVLDRVFGDAFRKDGQNDFAMLDSILLFFSQLNSVFLVDVMGPFFREMLAGKDGGRRLDTLLGFNGLKVL